MARSKSSKFFIYAPKKYGRNKGKRLLGINYNYKGDIKNLTLQDLVDFLKEKNVNIGDVLLPGNFITTAKTN